MPDASVLPGDTIGDISGRAANASAGLLAPPAANPLAPQQAALAQTQRELAANEAQTKALVSKQNAALGTQASQMAAVSAQPMPTAQLQQVPPSPKLQQQQMQNAEDFFQIASVVAAIAGAFSRQHVTTALNAFGSAIKGMKQGQLDQFAQAHNEWKDASEAVIENNKVQVQQLDQVLLKRNASIQEIAARAQLVGAQFKNDILYQAGVRQDITTIAGQRDAIAKSTEEFQQNHDKLEQGAQEAKQKINAALAVHGMKMNDDGSVERLPDLGTGAGTGDFGKSPKGDVYATWMAEHAGDNGGKGPTAAQKQAFVATLGTGAGGGFGSSIKQMQVNRVILAGNESAKDLANVVQLPIGSSSGFFGGRTLGTDIMGAGKEALANTMTSQEVQSYNVMATGFQRSLAAIEAAGLAPRGNLTQQMESVIFRVGDTELTKLQKLAQTRQIVEAGLEIMTADPTVPPQLKSKIGQIVASIRKSVPFTQSDLIRLQQAQETNPDVTLRDIMPKPGAPAAGTVLRYDAQGNPVQ